MKKIFILIGLFLGLNAFSQSDTNYNPRINQMSLQHFIETEFSEHYSSELQNIGVSGVCYTMFQIDTTGHLINIHVSPGTNELLVKFLKTTLEKTNGFWYSSTNGKLLSNKYIVLPLVYNLQKNGKTVNAATEPQALLSFFNQDNNSNPVNLVFLNKVEYTSPFDDNNTWKKLKIVNKNF